MLSMRIWGNVEESFKESFTRTNDTRLRFIYQEKSEACQLTSTARFRYALPAKEGGRRRRAPGPLGASRWGWDVPASLEGCSSVLPGKRREMKGMHAAAGNS